MRFSFASTVALALAPSAFAQYFDSFTAPTRDQVLPAGVPFDITWAPLGVAGTISITLLEGATNITLQTGPAIASGVNNLDGKYTWTPTDGGFATYGFLISDEKNTTLTEYSAPFHIKGSGTSSSAISGSTTTIKLSTGPSYTASATSTSTSTSSIPSSTVTVVSTSTSANITSSFPSATPSPSSSGSNITLSSTLTTARTTAAGTTVVGSTPASTASTAPSSSTTATNAARANFANGGLAALGGLILALAL